MGSAVDGRAANLNAGSSTMGFPTVDSIKAGYVPGHPAGDAAATAADNIGAAAVNGPAAVGSAATGRSAAVAFNSKSYSAGATAGDSVDPSAGAHSSSSALRLPEQLQPSSQHPCNDMHSLIRIHGQMGESFTGSCHSAGRGAVSRSSQSGSEMLTKSEPGAPSGGGGRLSWLFGR